MKARLRIVTIGGFIGYAICARSAVLRADGQYCSNNGGGSPYVCVKWSQGGNPDPLTDFNFNFSDASNPDIILKVGDSNWRVWSQEGSSDTDPANLGDVLIDSTVTTDDFTVKIRNENTSGAGAVNMLSIDLDDSDVSWVGFSEIAGVSSITGNLGNLTVVKDGGGSGGSAALTVSGNVTGNVTLPKGAGFHVTGKFGSDNSGAGQDTMTIGDITSANMTLGSIEDAYINVTGTISGSSGSTLGQLIITGAATTDCDIVVETMGNNAVLKAGNAAGGLDALDMSVWVRSDVPAGSKIDLSGGDMVGSGILLTNISTSVKYDLDGEVHVGEWNGTTFWLDEITGTLRFTRMESNTITIFGAVDATGDIIIDDDLADGLLDLRSSMAGSLEVGDDVLGGEVEIDGSVSGSILVLGDISDASGETLDLNSTLSGTLDVNGTMSNGLIDVAGAVSGPISLGNLSGGLLDLNSTVSSTISIDDPVTGGDMSGGEIEVTGAVSSNITIGDDFTGGLVELQGQLTGNFQVSGDFALNGTLTVNSVGSGGDILVSGAYNGSTTVTTTMAGNVDIDGAVGNYADITLTGAVTGPVSMGSMTAGALLLGSTLSTNYITVNGDMTAGSIEIDGAVSSNIMIGDDFGTYASIFLDSASDMTGDIDINDQADGDITIDGSMKGDIDVGGAVSSDALWTLASLGSSGRLIVYGLMNGDVDVVGATVRLSQMIFYGGIDDYCVVTVNTGQGNFNAAGDIFVGSTNWFCDGEPPCYPPPNIIYDGCIRVKDDPGDGSHGDLTGHVTVTGCHATSTALGRDVEGGDITGTQTIEQTSCSPTVTWGSCP